MARRRRCAKIRYRTELDAKIALANAQKRHSEKNRDKVECRQYQCPRCKGYHLTSMPLNGSKA